MFKFNMVTMGAVIMILTVPIVGFSQGYVQQVGATGNVNWTQQVVRCTGIGAPNPDLPMAAQRAAALRAARSDALRNLLETIKGIYLTSETTVENAMLVSDVIRTRVEGAMRDFNVVDTRYMSTGDVEVDVEIPLTGVVLDGMLPSAQQFGGGVLMTGGLLLCPVCGQPWPAGQPVPEGVTLIQAGEGVGTQSTGGLYTGLIIDGRGLGVRPAMAPKVLENNGEEIYGSKFVSREYAVDIGMVGYEKDINRARLNERVADNPLVVKGMEATGANMTDIIISNADAMQIHNAAANMNFLQHCKVMFILD
ncbi:LPP20 family lipoprotein [bacterium]|nr:LPP20 family lipoprotein [bacterium]